jgi:hypothetical protein
MIGESFPEGSEAEWILSRKRRKGALEHRGSVHRCNTGREEMVES